MFLIYISICFSVKLLTSHRGFVCVCKCNSMQFFLISSATSCELEMQRHKTCQLFIICVCWWLLVTFTHPPNKGDFAQEILSVQSCHFIHCLNSLDFNWILFYYSSVEVVCSEFVWTEGKRDIFVNSSSSDGLVSSHCSSKCIYKP